VVDLVGQEVWEDKRYQQYNHGKWLFVDAIYADRGLVSIPERLHQYMNWWRFFISSYERGVD